MSFLTIVLDIAATCFAFTLGWKAKARTVPDYKRRWQQAVALLKDEQTRTLAGIPDGSQEVVQKKKDPAKSEDPVARLLKMTGEDRYYMERERLRNHLAPIDPLTNLNTFWYSGMVKNRMYYGYDETGKRFK